MAKSILIIDDELDIRLLLSKFLEKNGYEVAATENGTKAIERLKKERSDLVICDFRLPDYTGLEILSKIKIIDPSIQVIIITGYSDVRIAVEALKKGAYEYVTKPLYPEEILNLIEEALASARNTLKPTPEKDTTIPDHLSRTKKYIEGSSEPSKLVTKHINLIAPTEMSVIITGETGTGKEYVARNIHEKSNRSNGAFIALDCGALPENLAGSELFGHVKGAFTGALQDKKGCFEVASGGTLFLDELGNLSYENQIKLLRVLQEKTVRRIGSNEEIPIDVRVIVATNESLQDKMEKGRFREDLYYRLNEFTIHIQPLRTRPMDIDLFAHHFLKDANRQLGKRVAGINKRVLQVFKSYAWYGNLRELRNVIKRAVLLTDGDELTMNAIPAEISVAPSDHERDEIEIRNLTDSDTVRPLKEIVQQAEKAAIIGALRKTNNNKSKTASMLGVDRKTLYNKLSTYQIDI
jgi:two-component system response regulator HydG